MKYRNEEDKCYGITGMAIGITIWNGEDMLYKLDLERGQSIRAVHFRLLF